MAEEKSVSERAKRVAADYLYLTKECNIATLDACDLLREIHPTLYEVRREPMPLPSREEVASTVKYLQEECQLENVRQALRLTRHIFPLVQRIEGTTSNAPHGNTEPHDELSCSESLQRELEADLRISQQL